MTIVMRWGVGQCKKGKKDVRQGQKREKVRKKGKMKKKKKLQGTKFRKQSYCSDVHGENSMGPCIYNRVINT